MTGQHAAARPHTDTSKAPALPPALRRALTEDAVLGISINDNWANYATDVPWLVHHLHPLIMGVQEGYRREYRHELGGRWGVKQRLGNKAEAGVAIIFDRHRLHQIGRHRPTDHQPHKIGHGWDELATASDTRARGVIWTDLEVDKPIPGIPDRFRLASWHRFPVRDKAEWGRFDRPAVHWLRESPLPVIVFQDSNEHGGPTGIAEKIAGKYGWHAAGQSIDGALVHEKFHAGPVFGLAPRTSDHGASVIMLGTAA